MDQYVKTADQYNVDLSEFTDTISDTAQAIREAYGRTDLAPKSNDETAIIQRGKPETYASKDLSGVNYTNIALYQIFLRRFGSSGSRFNPLITAFPSSLESCFPGFFGR